MNDHAKQTVRDLIRAALNDDTECLGCAIDAANRVLDEDADAEPLGRADWIWDDELQCHIPCCTVQVRGPHHWDRCSNGPLTGEKILSGDCGEHRTIEPDRFV